MRITLNLSAADSARDRFALAWAVPATLFGLAGLVVLGVSMAREFRAYRAVQGQVAEIQRRHDQLHAREATIRRQLEKPEYSDLLRRTRYINALIDKKQLSLTDLAGRLGDLLPDEVRLTGLMLAQQKEDLMLRMTISGKSAEAVEAFLSDLSDAPDFKDVTLINQGFQVESAQPGQVVVGCTARYLPGAQ